MTMPDTRSGGREGSAVGDEQSLPGTGSAGEGGAGSGGGAREQLRQARDKVVDQAKTTLRDARDRAGSGLDDGRRRAAEQIGGIGGAFHRTGEQLRNEDQQKFADVADSLGRQIDRVADCRSMARDVENLARRQPALVFAGAFALGLAAARFLKSSEPGYRSDDSGYDRIQPGGQPAGLGSDFNRSQFERGVGGFDAPA